MQQTPKNHFKTVATVFVAIFLAISGCAVLAAAKSMPSPHGPVITNRNL